MLAFVAFVSVTVDIFGVGLRLEICGSWYEGWMDGQKRREEEKRGESNKEEEKRRGKKKKKKKQVRCLVF